MDSVRIAIVDMKKAGTSILIAASVLALIWSVLNHKRDPESVESPPDANTSKQSIVENRAEIAKERPGPRIEEQDVAEDSAKGGNLQAYIERLESANAILSGEKLQQAHFEIIEDSRRDLRGREMISFLHELLRKSSDNAFMYASNMCANCILLPSAKKGIAETLKLNDTQSNRKIASAVGRQLSHWSKQDVASLLSNYPDSQIRSALIEEYLRKSSTVRGVTSKDVNMFEDMIADGLATDAQVNSAIANARGSSEEFKKLLEGDEQIEGIRKAEYAQSVIEGWASSDPVSCAAYLNGKLSKSEDAGDAIQPNSASLVRTLVSNWAETSPQQAAEWVVKLPKGANYDAAAGTIGLSLLNNSPVESLAFVESIEDDKYRNHLLRKSLEAARRRSSKDMASRIEDKLESENAESQ